MISCIDVYCRPLKKGGLFLFLQKSEHDGTRVEHEWNTMEHQWNINGTCVVHSFMLKWYRGKSHGGLWAKTHEPFSMQ